MSVTSAVAVACPDDPRDVAGLVISVFSAETCGNSPSLGTTIDWLVTGDLDWELEEGSAGGGTLYLVTGGCVADAG